MTNRDVLHERSRLRQANKMVHESSSELFMGQLSGNEVGIKTLHYCLQEAHLNKGLEEGAREM